MNELFLRTKQTIGMDRFQDAMAELGMTVPANASNGGISVEPNGSIYFQYCYQDFVQNEDQVSRVEMQIPRVLMLKLIAAGVPVIE